MNRIVPLFRGWLPCATGIALLFGALALAPRTAAQPERPKHVTFKVSVAPADPFADQNGQPAGSKLEVRRGDKFLVNLEGTPEPGWHTYPIVKHTDKQSPVQLSKVRAQGGQGFRRPLAGDGERAGTGLR